jgi:predicted transcriptional regulator
MVLTAEDEHRKQKEHFAELEIADEAAHQKHLEERAHAEKMKKYLEKEQGVVLKRNEEKEAVIA